MKACVDVKELSARLKRIEGQVRGILNMINEDKPCEEILVQISAAKSAMHKVGQRVLEGHLRHCVVDGIRNGDEEETIQRLAEAVEQFARLG